MAGPQINLTMGSEALAKIGHYTAAAKVARKEVQQLQKEATKTSKLLGATHGLALQQTRAADDARKRLEGYQKQAKDALAPAHMAHDVKMYGKLAHARAVKDIMSGEGGLQDYLMLAESRKLRKVAAKVGLEGAATMLTAAAPYAAMALVTYESIKHMSEQIHKEAKDARNVGRMYGSGQITKEAFEYFQEKNSWMHPFTDPKEALNALLESSKAVAGEPEKERRQIMQDAFKSISKDRSVSGAWKHMMGETADTTINAAAMSNELEEKITANIHDVEKEAHRALSPEERKEETEKFMEKYLSSLPSGMKDTINKAVKEAHEKMEAEKRKAPLPTAKDLYDKEHDKENRKFINHARDKRFSAAESFGQILWCGE